VLVPLLIIDDLGMSTDRRPTMPSSTLAAVVFPAGATTMIAQQKPDFSGLEIRASDGWS
jgi:hypothetical protein